MIYNLKGHNIHLDEVAGIDKSSEPIISINYKNKPSVSIPFQTNQEAENELAYLVEVWHNYVIDKAFKPREVITQSV